MVLFPITVSLKVPQSTLHNDAMYTFEPITMFVDGSNFRGLSLVNENPGVPITQDSWIFAVG